MQTMVPEQRHQSRGVKVSWMPRDSRIQLSVCHYGDLVGVLAGQAANDSIPNTYIRFPFEAVEPP